MSVDVKEQLDPLLLLIIWGRHISTITTCAAATRYTLSHLGRPSLAHYTLLVPRIHARLLLIEVLINIRLDAFDLFDTRIGSTSIFVFIGELKASIHILSLEVAAVVPQDYAVRISYGQDPKVKVLPQLLDR
jgi:hypothetical protein